jgi:hypothetical protein
MPAGQASVAPGFVACAALRSYILGTSRPELANIDGVRAVQFAFPRHFRDIFGLSVPHDEHLLAGADQEAVQALGVSQPVLARFQAEVAVLCPDLVHEAQFGLGRR